MHLLNIQYPQVLCYLVLHRLNHPPHHFFSNTVSKFSSFAVRDLGKWYAVKHNCVTWGVFNDYTMNNYMFRPVLATHHVRAHTCCKILSFSKTTWRWPVQAETCIVHYIVIEYTSCDTVVFGCISFSKFHTHNGDDTLPRCERPSFTPVK